MARKSKQKIKIKLKPKYRKIVTTIAIVLILIFAVVCYFNPDLYNSVLNFLSGKTKKPEIIVEGIKTTVKQEDFNDLEVHFVDVGQGDCILIKLPDYKNVLIDSGQHRSSEVVDYIKNVAKIDVFDYVIATHADSDHIDNMNEIFEAVEVKHVYRPYVKSTNANFTFDDYFNKGSGTEFQNSKTYAEFLQAIKDEKYGDSNTATTWEFFTKESDFAGEIEIAETGELFNYYFDFMSPTVSLDKLDYTDANDYSPIIKFTYQGFDILLTGDAEAEAEADFIDYYKDREVDLDVEVLKMGHHGSRTSSSQSLLDLVKPEYAVFQCGLGNTYGHPHKEVLTRLNNFAVPPTIYRNDLHGNIVMKINSSGALSGGVSLETPSKYPSSYLFLSGDEIKNLTA